MNSTPEKSSSDHISAKIQESLRTRGSAIFDCIPIGQVEPKVLMKDGAEWRQTVGSTIDYQTHEILKEEVRDPTFEHSCDATDEDDEDQFGNLFEEEESKEALIELIGYQTPSQ
jgi:hypothetical protein